MGDGGVYMAATTAVRVYEAPATSCREIHGTNWLMDQDQAELVNLALYLVVAAIIITVVVKVRRCPAPATPPRATTAAGRSDRT